MGVLLNIVDILSAYQDVVLAIGVLALTIRYFIKPSPVALSNEGNDAISDKNKQAPAQPDELSTSQPVDDDAAPTKQIQIAVGECLVKQLTSLDISKFPVTTLPGELSSLSSSLEMITLAVPNSTADLTELTKLTSLKSVTVKGAVAYANVWLTIFSGLEMLETLDISECRVKDSNNSAKGVCSAKDIFNFQQRKLLREITLPPLGAVEIGKISKVYAKAKVVVIELKLPLRLGDVIDFRRILKHFTGDANIHNIGHSNHQFKTSTTTVSSIRTDDHKQLKEASPTKNSPLKSQFAVAVDEVGKAGDLVFWTGRK